tara:strand:+ start:1382 stop:2203 length:822 start_codon:yes stop_codon:yes gene_type:complete
MPNQITHVVAIVGHSRTGKDTIALHMQEVLQDAGIAVINDSFASPLRTAVQCLAPARALDKTPKGNYRFLMFGISALVKAILGEDVFTKRLIEDASYRASGLDRPTVLIVSDVRQLSELMALREFSDKHDTRFSQIHVMCEEIDTPLRNRWWHKFWDNRNEFVSNVSNMKQYERRDRIDVVSKIDHVEELLSHWGVSGTIDAILTELGDLRQSTEIEELVDAILPTTPVVKTMSQLIKEALEEKEASLDPQELGDILNKKPKPKPSPPTRITL